MKFLNKIKKIIIKSLAAIIISSSLMIVGCSVYGNSAVSVDNNGNMISPPKLSGNINAATAGTATKIAETNNNYFVDCVHGNDTNNGNISFPWATLTNAEVKLPSGSTLYVASGNYFADGGIINHFTFTNNITLIGNGINNTFITNILSIGKDTTLKKRFVLSSQTISFWGSTN